MNIYPISFGGAEKKKEKDEVDDKVDSQSNVKTLPSGMVIEEVVVGDPNKGTATEGRMVCANIHSYN